MASLLPVGLPQHGSFGMFSRQLLLNNTPMVVVVVGEEGQASSTTPKTSFLVGSPQSWLPPELLLSFQLAIKNPIFLVVQRLRCYTERGRSRASKGSFIQVPLWRHSGDICLPHHHPFHRTVSPMFHQPFPVELVHEPSHSREHSTQEKRERRHGRNCECEQCWCPNRKSQSLWDTSLVGTPPPKDQS